MSSVCCESGKPPSQNGALTKSSLRGTASRDPQTSLPGYDWQEGERFGRVPLLWLTLDLKPTSLRVVIAMTTFADRPGRLEVSLETIARAARVAVRHVQEALSNELIPVGIVEREPTGRGVCASYRLHRCPLNRAAIRPYTESVQGLRVRRSSPITYSVIDQTPISQQADTKSVQQTDYTEIKQTEDSKDSVNCVEDSGNGPLVEEICRTVRGAKPQFVLELMAVRSTEAIRRQVKMWPNRNREKIISEWRYFRRLVMADANAAWSRQPVYRRASGPRPLWDIIEQALGERAEPHGAST